MCEQLCELWTGCFVSYLNVLSLLCSFSLHLTGIIIQARNVTSVRANLHCQRFVETFLYAFLLLLWIKKNILHFRSVCSAPGISSELWPDSCLSSCSSGSPNRTWVYRSEGLQLPCVLPLVYTFHVAFSTLAWLRTLINPAKARLLLPTANLGPRSHPNTAKHWTVRRFTCWLGTAAWVCSSQFMPPEGLELTPTHRNSRELINFVTGSFLNSGQQEPLKA